MLFLYHYRMYMRIRIITYIHIRGQSDKFVYGSHWKQQT